jgi:Aldo/keto reductases, related to diketogulonate reductase
MATLAALPLLSFDSFENQSSMVSTRKIPSTGELLPVVGLGTWQTFDVYGNRTERATLSEVLKTLVNYGGRVVDSSPCMVLLKR